MCKRVKVLTKVLKKSKITKSKGVELLLQVCWDVVVMVREGRAFIGEL